MFIDVMAFRGGAEAVEIGCNSCGTSSDVASSWHVWTVIDGVIAQTNLLSLQCRIIVERIRVFLRIVRLFPPNITFTI